MNCIDFKAEQVKLVLTGLISQTILPYNDSTKDLKQDMILSLSFEGEVFKNYQIKILNVRITSIRKLNNKDIFLNGFLYKPHFIKYMQQQGFNIDDTILRVSFELVKLKE